jgi:hypothetical protein
MDTMTSITTWRSRQEMADNLDSQGRRRNSDRTPVTGVPLRDVAARQGAALRSALATRPTPAAQRMAERVAAVRAEQNAPAPVARPAVATVGERPTYKQVNDLAASIPTGMYALPRKAASSAGNTVTFFKIHPFRGGHRIVQLVGSVGAFAEQPLALHLQFFALKHIAENAKAAAVLFGKETNTCGRCGSPLTNDASRARGLGPKCARAY